MTRQVFSIRDARAPQPSGELLTLREACARFGVYPQVVWAWVAAGQVHAVRPHGRVLYPEWELSSAASRLTATYARRLAA